MAYKQPSSGLPFKEVGSSPAKDTKRPHQANGMPKSRADSLNAKADSEHKAETKHPHGVPYASPAKQAVKPVVVAREEARVTKKKKKLPTFRKGDVSIPQYSKSGEKRYNIEGE